VWKKLWLEDVPCASVVTTVQTQPQILRDITLSALPLAAAVGEAGGGQGETLRGRREDIKKGETSRLLNITYHLYIHILDKLYLCKRYPHRYTSFTSSYLILPLLCPALRMLLLVRGDAGRVGAGDCGGREVRQFFF
jgi:hypothetical protein